MAVKEFAEYKYNSGTGAGRAPKIILLVFISIAIAVAGAAFFPPVLFLLIIPVILIVKAAKSGDSNVLFIGGRYMIAGGTVIYYSNVNKFRLDNQNYVCTISTGSGRTIDIKADNFPTNARKSDKIVKNKKNKFDTAVKKISERIKHLQIETI